jgi:hypothetical protein
VAANSRCFVDSPWFNNSVYFFDLCDFRVEISSWAYPDPEEDREGLATAR